VDELRYLLRSLKLGQKGYRVKCPDCGKPLRRLNGNSVYYACDNPRCSVIEVRMYKERVRVVRDSVMCKKRR